MSLWERTRALASAAQSKLAQTATVLDEHTTVLPSFDLPLVNSSGNASARFRCTRRLGEGGFGVVYEAEMEGNRHGGKSFAIKHLKCGSASQLAQAKQEVALLRKLKNCPKTVDLFAAGVFSGGNVAEVVMALELCTGGSVAEALERLQTKPGNQRFLSEKALWTVFADVLEAVGALHSLSPPVAHRDLKAENVLIQRSPSGAIYKLCDFGSATSKVFPTESASSRATAEEDVERNTTMEYRAPEMCDLFRGQVLDIRVDVWALGVLLYRLAFYQMPFEEGSNLAILNGNFEIPHPGSSRNPFSANVGKVITACFQQDPSARPTVAQLAFKVAPLAGRAAPAFADATPLKSKPATTHDDGRLQCADVVGSTAAATPAKASQTTQMSVTAGFADFASFDAFGASSQTDPFDSFHPSNNADPFDRSSKRNPDSITPTLLSSTGVSDILPAKPRTTKQSLFDMVEFSDPNPGDPFAQAESRSSTSASSQPLSRSTTPQPNTSDLLGFGTDDFSAFPAPGTTDDFAALDLGRSSSPATPSSLRSSSQQSADSLVDFAHTELHHVQNLPELSPCYSTRHGLGELIDDPVLDDLRPQHAYIDGGYARKTAVNSVFSITEPPGQLDWHAARVSYAWLQLLEPILPVIRLEGRHSQSQTLASLPAAAKDSTIHRALSSVEHVFHDVVGLLNQHRRKLHSVPVIALRALSLLHRLILLCPSVCLPPLSLALVADFTQTILQTFSGRRLDETTPTGFHGRSTDLDLQRFTCLYATVVLGKCSALTLLRRSEFDTNSAILCFPASLAQLISTHADDALAVVRPILSFFQALVSLLSALRSSKSLEQDLLCVLTPVINDAGDMSHIVNEAVLFGSQPNSSTRVRDLVGRHRRSVVLDWDEARRWLRDCTPALLHHASRSRMSTRSHHDNDAAIALRWILSLSAVHLEHALAVALDPASASTGPEPSLWQLASAHAKVYGRSHPSAHAPTYSEGRHGAPPVPEHETQPASFVADPAVGDATKKLSREDAIANQLQVFADLRLRDTENARCCDCGRRDPTWAVINIGCFVCLQCSGIHRSLGTHISKVRSTTLDVWQPSAGWLQQCERMGNSRVNKVLLGNAAGIVLPTPSTTSADLKSHITNKYALRKYAAAEAAQILPPPLV